MGRGFKSHKSTKRKPPAGARWHVPPVNPPVVGSRVRVYWPAEDAWFRGTAAETILQDGALIFRVAYDDGDEAWVAAFGDDKWAFADAAAAAAASDAARVAAAAAEAIAEAEGCGLCLWGSVFVSVCRACLRFAWSLRRARLASRVSTTCVSQSEVRPADQGLLHAQVVRMRVLHASVRLCLCVTAQGAQQIQAAPFGSLGAVQAPAQASQQNMRYESRERVHAWRSLRCEDVVAPDCGNVACHAFQSRTGSYDLIIQGASSLWRI